MGALDDANMLVAERLQVRRSSSMRQWAEALGGPTTSSTAYGDETSVVRLHSGSGPHEEMDRRAIACFDQPLEDVGIARRRPAAAGAPRLLRLGDHNHDVALSPVGG